MRRRRFLKALAGVIVAPVAFACALAKTKSAPRAFKIGKMAYGTMAFSDIQDPTTYNTAFLEELRLCLLKSKKAIGDERYFSYDGSD